MNLKLTNKQLYPKRKQARFELNMIECVGVMVHKFGVKEVKAPTEIDDYYVLFESVGDDQLLVRREHTPARDRWVVLHREPRSTFMGSGGYKFLFDGHIYLMDAITRNASGRPGLFMLWRKA